MGGPDIGELEPVEGEYSELDLILLAIELAMDERRMMGRKLSRESGNTSAKQRKNNQQWA